MADITEFLAGLQKTLNDALASDGNGNGDEAKTQKSAQTVTVEMPDDLKKGLEAMTTLAKAFAPADEKGENAGEVTAFLTDMKKTLDAHSEVLEKTLDRLSTVEGVTVIRKSADGDDFSDTEKDGGKAGDQKPVQKAKGSDAGWGPVVNTLLGGGKVRLTG